MRSRSSFSETQRAAAPQVGSQSTVILRPVLQAEAGNKPQVDGSVLQGMAVRSVVTAACHRAKGSLLREPGPGLACRSFITPGVLSCGDPAATSSILPAFFFLPKPSAATVVEGAVARLRPPLPRASRPYACLLDATRKRVTHRMPPGARPAILCLGLLLLVPFAPAPRGDDGRAERLPPDRQPDLPAVLHLRWQRDLPRPQPAWPDQPKMPFDAAPKPAVLGHTVFVPSTVTDGVTAYDARHRRRALDLHHRRPRPLRPGRLGGPPVRRLRRRLALLPRRGATAGCSGSSAAARRTARCWATAG